MLARPVTVFTSGDRSLQEQLGAQYKYFEYYQEAYGAVLGGLVGTYAIAATDESGETVWKPAYGLKAFSPIAAAAAYLWQKVMASIHEGLESKSFQRPTDVVECSYCRDSGLLATSACRADPRGNCVVSGLLALEDAPTEYCNVHTLVDVCDATEHVANEYCAQAEGNGTHQVGLLKLMRAFPRSAKR